MRLREARALADRLVTRLEPHVARVVVAGSVRRQRPQVKDVELVVEPRVRSGDLFGREVPDLAAIRHEARTWGQIMKGGDRYIQVALDDPKFAPPGTGARADVFLVHPPAEWGTILAIRTGPAAFSRHCVERLRARGMRSIDGAVYRKIKGDPFLEPDLVLEDAPEWDRYYRRVPTPTEDAFFELAGVECVPAEQRDELHRRLTRRTVPA